jgi:predicted methyltransferase
MNFFKKKNEKRAPYTVEECQTCNMVTKHKFKEGDYLFKESSKCQSCEGKMVVVKIFGEIIKE